MMGGIGTLRTHIFQRFHQACSKELFPKSIYQCAGYQRIARICHPVCQLQAVFGHGRFLQLHIMQQRCRNGRLYFRPQCKPVAPFKYMGAALETCRILIQNRSTGNIGCEEFPVALVNLRITRTILTRKGRHKREPVKGDGKIVFFRSGRCPFIVNIEIMHPFLATERNRFQAPLILSLHG